MKRTLNTTINRSKSETNDEHYTQFAAAGVQRFGSAAFADIMCQRR